MHTPPQPPVTVDPYTMGPPLDPITSLRAALRGHYEIEREIGQGAYATVYLARDLKHERKVAIKVLHADPSSETGELRFIREIRLLARLQHPNILPLHDSGHVEALLYYVMPYVSGETLRDRIDREKQLPYEAACNIARDVADALGYAHGQGIIHRDIKPENILLSAGHPILADFGIARVIDLAGVRQVTRTGMGSPGTPAYMSPEQLMGDKELDGRSDTYSLGCVLFEMLTGRPPFSGKEGFVKRFTEPPPVVSTVRRDVPAWMDDVVATALARAPNDRYQTAQEFVSALSEPKARIRPAGVPPERAVKQQGVERAYPAVRAISDSAHPSRARRLIEQARLHRWLTAGIAIVVVILGSWFATGTRAAGIPNLLGRPAQIDSSRFVILPFAISTSTDDPRIGSHIADRLYDAFSQWEGLPLVADTRVAQAISRQGSPPVNESDALALARGLGAGKLVWGQASGRPDQFRVRIHLYDVASQDSKRDALFLSARGDEDPYSAATQQLLRVPNRPREADGGDGLTRSFVAWSAYGQGHVALSRWDIAGAEKAFRTAISADQFYSPPRIWLAQLLAWQTAHQRGEWQELAMRAAGERSKLSDRDRAILNGLVAMSAQKYPDACQIYAGLTRADSLDFAGWYGLGECQFLDQQVVPSTESPSKWRFRSSYHEAAVYYMRALRLEPGAHVFFPFERLERLLPTAATQVRSGRGPAPEQTLFVAYPGLVGDSLLFIPYSLAEFQNLSPRTTNPRQSAALSRDALILREFVNDWTRRAPTSAEAFEALGGVLEGPGSTLENAPGKPTALSALRRARALSSTTEQRQRIAAREVWVHFKNSDFPAARSLADSILDEYGRQPSADPRNIVGLAAITGRLLRTGELARSSREWEPAATTQLSPAIGAAAGRFFALAALGVCGPAFDAAERELDQKLDSFVADDQKDGLRAAIKARPLMMIGPCTNGQSALRIGRPGSRIARAQQAYAAKDTRRLRVLLDSAITELKLRPPADLSFDYIYQLSWLRAASGDSAGALGQLERSLNALPSVSTSSLKQAAVAGAAMRAMVLNAELASRLGSGGSSQRWANAVADLWGGADPLLQPTVTQMRNLGRGRPSD